MRVLVIPPEAFIPDDAPLSAIFQYHQAVALSRRGIAVAVISVTPSIAVKPLLISLLRRVSGLGTFYNPVRGMGVSGILRLLWSRLRADEETRMEEIDGLQVLRIRRPCWSDIRPEDQLDYYKDCVLHGYRIMAAAYGRPDLIHAHNAWLAGTATLALARTERLPYCITEHSTFYARGLIPGRCHPLLREVYACSALNLVVSSSLGSALLASGLLPEGYRVLANLLDPYFEELALTPSAPCPPTLFLNVAELTEKKGQAILIRAFAKVCEVMGEARLVIGGEGSLADELARLAGELGVADRVSFKGRLGRREVSDWMRACHVFVLPSLVETFGVVLIEANACGRPVVATVCGGPEDIVTEGNGVLVPPSDADALAAAMLSVARRLSDYDPVAIRSGTLDRYGSEYFTKALLDHYSRILQRASNL